MADDQVIQPLPAELKLEMSFARVGVRQYFEAEHLWAARLAAHLCRTREDELLANEFHGVDYHVRSFAVMAIQESVAFLEARVNTIWQDAADVEESAEVVDNPRLGGLEAGTIARLRELWQYDAVQRSLSLLEKFDAVVRTARKPEMDKSRRPYQDVQSLVGLRNALVHFKPETQWNDEIHRLQSRLRHLPENPLLPGTQPWFPHQPLCAAAAEWAWQSCLAFAQEWESLLGLTDPYVEQMGKAAPWPDI